VSSILSKVNLSGLTVVSPADALSMLASRGEWAQLAQAVASQLHGSTPGSVVRFDSIGLTPDDFKRTTKTATRKIGEVDYSGITSASRGFGLLVKRLVDESRGFYVPQNADEIIAKVKQQRKTAAAKAKAAKKS
jgi:hypothetical protein